MTLANEEAAKQKMAKLEDSLQATPPVAQIPQEIASVSATGAISLTEPMETSDEMPAPAAVIEVEAKCDLNTNDMTTNKEKKTDECRNNIVGEKPANQAIANAVAEDNVNSPLRRGSQESTATTTTQTTTTTGSDSTDSSSDSSSTGSSSSDSDDSSSEDDANKVSSYSVFESKEKKTI